MSFHAFVHAHALYMHDCMHALPFLIRYACDTLFLGFLIMENSFMTFKLQKTIMSSICMPSCIIYMQACMHEQTFYENIGMWHIVLVVFQYGKLISSLKIINSCHFMHIYACTCMHACIHRLFSKDRHVTPCFRGFQYSKLISSLKMVGFAWNANTPFLP